MPSIISEMPEWMQFDIERNSVKQQQRSTLRRDIGKRNDSADLDRRDCTGTGRNVHFNLINVLVQYMETSSRSKKSLQTRRK